MRKFNPREKEFLKLLEKISHDDLEFFSYFMQREFFTIKSNSALVLIPQKSSAILFIKKEIFDDLKLRKEEIRKFIEIISLTEYLKQARLIDLIPIPSPPQISMHLMRADFDTPIQATPTSDIILNKNGLHFKYPELNKIYDDQNDIVFEGVTLEKYTYELIINNFMGLLFVSEDLKEYVKRGYKSIEDIRYRHGQIATWVSISIALLFGLFAIYNPFSTKEDLKLDSQQYDTLILQEKLLNSKVNSLLIELKQYEKNDTINLNLTKY